MSFPAIKELISVDPKLAGIQDRLITTMRDIYVASPLAQALFDKILEKGEFFMQASNDPVGCPACGGTSLGLTGFRIVPNYFEETFDSSNFVFLDRYGYVRHIDFERILVHESVHSLLSGFRDVPSYLDPPLGSTKEPDPDYKGRTVDRTNKILEEYANYEGSTYNYYERVAYPGRATNNTDLEIGTSLSFGREVDLAVIAQNYANQPQYRDVNFDTTNNVSIVDDLIVGRDDANDIKSGIGDDYLYGFAGNDTLNSGRDADYLNGGVGNDSLIPGPGNDTVIGGPGFDTLQFFGLFGDYTLELSSSPSLGVTGQFSAERLLPDSSPELDVIGEVEALQFRDKHYEIVVGSDDSDLIELGHDSNFLNWTLDAAIIGGGGLDIFDFQNYKPLSKSTETKEFVIIDFSAGDRINLPKGSEFKATSPFALKPGQFFIYDIGNDDAIIWRSAGELSTRLNVLRVLDADIWDHVTIGGRKFVDPDIRGTPAPFILTGSKAPKFSTIDQFLGTGDFVRFSEIFEPPTDISTKIDEFEILGPNTESTISFDNKIIDARSGFVFSDVDRLTISADKAGGSDKYYIRASSQNSWSDWIEVSIRTDTPKALFGSDENDTIAGGVSDDTIVGRSGDDWLSGEAGNDELSGQDGEDVIRGGDGDDRAWGGSGGDRIAGGAGNDSLNGDTGEDEMHGDAGDDFVWGLAGDDRIWGGEGNDDLRGGGGNDRMNGDAGNDSMRGDGGDDFVWGLAGNDRIWGGGGNDDLRGGSGNDRINGDAGNDSIRGDGGDDVLWGFGGKDLIWGDDGNDWIDGGNNSDFLVGGNGDDTLIGQMGNDKLMGGTGRDTLMGGSANDTLKGGEDGDSISGQGGSDSLSGDSGNDTLIGGASADTIDGGSGDDLLDGGAFKDMLFGGADDDTLLGGAREDTLDGGAGSDSLDGGSGNDVLLGGADADTLFGGTGADDISGDRGDDSLAGGNGNDKLDGGIGNDTMTGGTGADVFVFAIGNGYDRISDFNDTVDQIDVSDFGFASVSDFLTQASDVDESLVFVLGSDQLFVDGWSIAQVDSSNLIV